MMRPGVLFVTRPVRDKLITHSIMKAPWYTYVLESEKDGDWYTGSTGDLQQRLKDHNAGRVESTKNRRPLKTIYYEVCLNGQYARAREKFLKSGPGKRYLKNQLKRYLN